jgi:hypothetical protein
VIRATVKDNAGNSSEYRLCDEIDVRSTLDGSLSFDPELVEGLPLSEGSPLPPKA